MGEDVISGISECFINGEKLDLDIKEGVSLPLFSPENPALLNRHDTDTCLSCVNRQRWECNSKVFQYCGIRKSKRTSNGLLKIKCKTRACGLYEKVTIIKF